MFDDLLFGFYQEKLTETFEPYVNNTNSRRLTIDDKTFFTTPTNDKRSGFIKTSTNFLTKYTVNVSDEKDKIVPNIRISEAYYIAAECLYKTDMKTAAADLMVVRQGPRLLVARAFGHDDRRCVLGGPDLRIPQGVHRRGAAHLLLQAHQPSDHLLRRQIRPQGQTHPARFPTAKVRSNR